MFIIRYLFCILSFLGYGCLLAQSTKPNLEKNRQGESMEFVDQECRLEEIEVVKFQDHGWNNNPDNEGDQKPYQVVVGRDIDYEGKPKSAVNWNWSFPSQWTGFSAKSRKYISNATATVGNQKIPKTDLPDENNVFGEANGVVKVTAETKRGEVFPDYISNEMTETNPNPWGAKVFFLKHDISNDRTTPNWFYYWTQLIQDRLNVSGLKLYTCSDDRNDPNPCTLNPSPTKFTFSLVYSNSGDYYYDPNATQQTLIFGSNSFKGRQIFRSGTDPKPTDGQEEFVPTALNLSVAEITIGEGSCTKCQNTTGSIGISCFLETLEHELEHYRIVEDLWGEGYSSLNDKDGDFYPDDWEIARKNEGIYLFDPMNPADKYNKNYNPISYQNGGLDPSATIGTNYEERRCRDHQASIDRDIFNDVDWSFDSRLKYQGKNW